MITAIKYKNAKKTENKAITPPNYSFFFKKNFP
jgi:hypothetical protein